MDCYYRAIGAIGKGLRDRGVVAVLLMTVKVVPTEAATIFPSTVKVPPPATVTPFAIEKSGQPSHEASIF